MLMGGEIEMAQQAVATERGVSPTSPRGSLRTLEPDEIAEALKTVGHIVLSDVWRPAICAGC
jgi:hypothetical protein